LSEADSRLYYREHYEVLPDTSLTSPPSADTAAPSATPREILLAAVALIAAIATLPLFGGTVLWTRPMWMDELCTAFVTEHDTLGGVIANIAEGGDWAPPLLHIIVWSLRQLAGELSPVLLRSIALTSVVIALVFLYATMRRRFGVAASAAACLAIAGHPLVVTHAFEGRPYGPWLMFAAAYAWSLGLDAGARSTRRNVVQAVSAVGLCTNHWFGVLSLGLMSLVVFLAHGRQWRDAVRFLIPTAVGLVALLICIPMVFTQRAAAEGLLWVKDLEFSQVSAMSKLFWFRLVPLGALVLLFREVLQPRSAPQAGVISQGVAGPMLRAAARDRGLIALGALVLMPVVLIVVSVTIQPSMVDRYALVTVLAWAPLVAAATESLGRYARGAMVALLLTVLAASTRDIIGAKQDYATSVHANQAVFEEAKAMNIPILFQYMHLVFPVAGPQRSPETLARFLDIPDSTLLALYPSPRVEWLRRQFRLERSQARLHARIYGFPILATQAQLDTTPRFLLLATDLQLPGGYKQAEKWGLAVFPRHKVTRLNGVLSLFERLPAPPPTSSRTAR
jgi:hypothetical protein